MVLPVQDLQGWARRVLVSTQGEQWGVIGGALPSLQPLHRCRGKLRLFPTEGAAAPTRESPAAGPGESPHPRAGRR